MAQEGEAGTPLRLATALYRFWFMRGRYAEGRKWLEDALGRDRDAPSAMVLKALEAAAHFARQQLDIAGAVALSERGLALAGARNDKAATATFLFGLGIVAEMQADLQRGRELCERSLSLWRELGDKGQIGDALRELGAIAYLQDDAERAVASLGESLELARDLGDKYRMATTLRRLANVALLRGEVQRATVYLTEGLTLSKETGNLLMIELCLEGISEVAAAEGRHDRAARLAGAAEALRESLGRHRSPTYQRIFERSVAAARSGLGEAAFLKASEVGRAMPVANAIEYALTTPAEEASRPGAKPKSGFSPLAPREREVAALVARGLTNRDIAAALMITERTAETHVQHILNKLGVGSRAQIAVWAADQGLLQK